MVPHSQKICLVNNAMTPEAVAKKILHNGVKAQDCIVLSTFGKLMIMSPCTKSDIPTAMNLFISGLSKAN